jgi:Transposase DDE domain group 1
MLKQPDPAPHKTTRTEITPLFGQAKLVLDETPKAVSPFGGLASFISFLGSIGFAPEVQRHLPFAEPTSNNAIPLAHCLTAFLMAVVVGAQRFAHCQWLRADRVLHALLGLERFPSDDTIRNFFLRFSQGHVEAFWRPLWRWLVRLIKCPAGGFALDLDSTVFCREGKQEGVLKGFNPRRKGRGSHHPLLAVLAEAHFLLHGWLRSGNTGAARGVVPFLQEALTLLPEGTWLRTVRADSGFFDGAFLDFLEERALPYVVVARLTRTLQRQCAGIKEWTLIDESHAAGEFTVKLFGWSKERRCVVVRERVRENQAAVGRQLLDVPGYTFRVWVTNRSEDPVTLWRDYNGRASVEQRIEELKHDLAADGFCLQPFYATEAAFLAVLLTFNLLSLYQHQTTPTAPYRQPGTLRVAVFLGGAVLGVLGREVVVKLSAAWGGLGKHKPLVAATLDWLKCASPKLVPPEDRLAIGGGLI